MAPASTPHLIADLQVDPVSGTAERMIEILRLVLRRWPLILAAALIAAAIVVATGWNQPRTYTSTGSFVLQGGRSASSFSGLASQFGISLPAGSDVGPSPGLYVEILRSRRVLGAVAHAAYCDPCSAAGPNVPLVRLLRIEGRDSGEVTDLAIRRLQSLIGADVSQRTGLITFSATAPSPGLAQQIARQALAAVTEFNLGARQTQAAAERRFTEQRLDDVAAELHRAEQRLRQFRESNRFIGSPELELRQDQLAREVRRYEEVYSALARSLEQSKIDEVRDTPSIMVIDSPGLPYRANPRGLLARTIFAGIFGALLAATILAAQVARRR